MRALRVGLTGGLAAGKSTVAARMAAAGWHVFDADQIVAELYRPGEAGAAAVRRLFGTACLAADGAVDVEAVAALVFADSDARQRLEAAIHPLVRQRFESLVEGTEGVVVLEATLLAESGLAAEFDLVVTVEADPAVQLRRAQDRGMARRAAMARLAAQSGAERRLGAAHRVIWNNGSQEDLALEVDRLIADTTAPTTAPAADGSESP